MNYINLTTLGFCYYEVQETKRGKYNINTSEGRSKVQKAFRALRDGKNVKPEILAMALELYEKMMMNEGQEFLKDVRHIADQKQAKKTDK